MGGESDAALRRAARLGQGWYSFNRLPDTLAEPLARLDGLLAGFGGSQPGRLHDLGLPVLPPSSATTVERCVALGVDRLIVLCLAFDTDTFAAQLDQLATDVLEPARALG